MKLGIITDIHEHVECLSAALDELTGCVDQIVLVGDVLETGDRIEETCRLLSDASVIGVWGNHDFGLCHDVNEEIRKTYSQDVFQFMGSLQPHLEIEDCIFTHVEPWLDPSVLEDLWFYDGMPKDRARLDRIFAAVPNRVIFAGHYHRWLLATPTEITAWHGESSINLGDERWFVVVNAMFAGYYAIFDSDTRELVPMRLAPTKNGKSRNFSRER